MSPSKPESANLVEESDPIEPDPNTELIARQRRRRRELQTTGGELLIPARPTQTSGDGVLIPTRRT